MRQRHIVAVFGVAFCVLQARPSRSEIWPQASQPELKGQSQFDPSRQRAVSAAKDGVQVQLIRSERCDTCRSAYRLTFRITSDTAPTPTDFELTNGPAAADEVHITPNGLIVVIGRNQASVHSFVILDRQGRVLDSALAMEPAMSPDETKLAFVKAYPQHFMEGVSNEYLVYDIAESGTDNRRGDVDISDDVDVGAPIFPTDAMNRSGDNVNVPEGFRHELRSTRLFWSADSQRLAFADLVNGNVSIVVAELGRGIRDPLVHSIQLDPTRLVTTKSCIEYRDHLAYAFVVSDIVFSDQPNELQVSFAYRDPACSGTDVASISLQQ